MIRHPRRNVERQTHEQRRSALRFLTSRWLHRGFIKFGLLSKLLLRAAPILLDNLSRLRGVRVDPTSRTVKVRPSVAIENEVSTGAVENSSQSQSRFIAIKRARIARKSQR